MRVVINLKIEGNVLGNNQGLLNKLITERKLTLEDIALVMSDEIDVYDKEFTIEQVDEVMDSSANQAIFDSYTDSTHTREIAGVRTITLRVK